MYFEMYKQYFDHKNKKILCEIITKQSPKNYDEFREINIESFDLGSNLISFLDLDYNLILSELHDAIGKFEGDFYKAEEFFISLMVKHEYFSCYTADFSRNAVTDYYDTSEWSELINDYITDFESTVYFVQKNLLNFINNSFNHSLSLKQYYYLKAESDVKKSHKTNILYSYPSTIECMIDYTESIYNKEDYEKYLFKNYIESNKNNLIQKYNEEKLKFSNEDDIKDKYAEVFYGYFESDYNNEINLSYERFMQLEFYEFCNQHNEEITKSYLEYLSKQNLTATECVVPESIKDILSFEFINIIKSDTIIKKCANCGKYFIPIGDYNVKYCDRIFQDSSSCKIIGGRRTTYNKIETTPALKLYDRYYKRYKAQIRSGKMSEGEFDLWNSLAKQKRNECVNGEITIDDFSEWLGTLH